MNDVTSTITGLFWIAVGVGALLMFVRNPNKSTQLIGSIPATIDGVVHGLESGKLDNTGGQGPAG